MLYGLIGKHLSHSKSADLFNEAFFPHHEYRLFEMENTNEIIELVKEHKDLFGLNITIPYKSEILKYLDNVDETAQKVGAVNTVTIKRESNHIYLNGFNTDVFGFYNAYKTVLSKKHLLALILGTGGAAKAVEFVLSQLSIPYLLVSRTRKDEKTILFNELGNMDYGISLIVNATPIGMFPKTDEIISLPLKLFNTKPDCIDLIYNPEQTSFMKIAQKHRCYSVNGMEMLKQQAYEAWKIWGLK